MLKTLLAAAAGFVLASSAGAQTAPAPSAAAPQRSWTEDVQCLAMIERTPDLMTDSARLMREVQAPTPEMKTMQASMVKAIDDARPVMLQAIKEFRDSILEDARSAMKADKAAADQTFERELQAARGRAARLTISSGSMEAQQAQMEAFKAEMERVCPSKTRALSR